VAKFDIVGGTVVGLNARADVGATGEKVIDASADGVTLDFDLKMVAAPTAGPATWKLKVESKSGATFAEIDLPTAPELDTWQSYSISAADLATAGLNTEEIDVVMIFPVWGTGDGASFHLDNVEFVGATEVDANVVPPGEPTSGAFVVYEDAINPLWAAWDCCGGSSPAVVTDADATYGNVVQFDISGNTVVGFTTRADHGVEGGAVHNATSNTTLEFDAKLVTQATGGATDWFLKVEAADGTWIEVNLNTSVENQTLALDEWRHFTFNLSNFTGLTLSEINIIMVHSWTGGPGASYRIDNVEFK
jgi:hypothetical protein